MGEIELEKDEGNLDKGSLNNYVPGKPYSKIRRDITDDDLANTAVQKLLLNEIDKLEISLAKLEGFQNQFYIIDKEKCILEEKLRLSTSNEVIYSFCLAVGSGIMGLSSLSKLKEQWWIFLVVGGLLIIGAILSRYKKWN